MRQPTTPQSLRTMYVVAAVLSGILAVLIGVLLVVLQGDHVFVFFRFVPVLMLGMVGMLAFLIGQGLRDTRRHSADNGGHWCMCVDCDRSGLAVGPPGQRRMGTAPRANRLNGIALIVMSIVAALIFLPLGMIFRLLAVAWFAVMVILMAGTVITFLVIGVGRILKASRGAALGPGHGCICRWCGAPARPLPTPPL